MIPAGLMRETALVGRKKSSKIIRKAPILTASQLLKEKVKGTYDT